MDINVGEWHIRDWRESDFESLVRHASNRSVWTNVRDRFPHPYTEQDGKDWLQLCSSQKPCTNFAIASVTEAIGGIGLELQDDVYTGSASWGTGWASRSGDRAS